MEFIWADIKTIKFNYTIIFEYEIFNSQGNEILYFCASNSYQVFENKELLAYGPYRAAHGYSCVDEVKLKTPGYKKIQIYVAAYNCRSYYQVQELPFFAAEVLRNGKTIAKSKDFSAYLNRQRISKVERYSYQRTFLEVYDLNKSRTPIKTITVSGNNLLKKRSGNCRYKKVQAYSYKKGFFDISNNEAVKFWWTDLPTEKFDRYETLEVFLSEEIFKFENSETLKEGKFEIFDFKRCVTGFVEANIIAIENSEIYFSFDEILVDDDVSKYRYSCNNFAKWNVPKGKLTLLTFEPYEMRYLKIYIKGNAIIESINMVLYQNDDCYNLDFNISDKDLQLICESAVHTLAQNSVDILTDCPGRERAGWLCDSFFSAQAEHFFCGNNNIEKNFLINYILTEKSSPKGMVPMCYPADCNSFIPNWAMFFLIELKDYYRRTKDYALIKEAKIKAYAIIEYFKKFINSEGLLEDLEGWIFVEWSDCNKQDYVCGVNYPSNMLYAKALNDISELYEDENLKSQSENMKKEIIKQAFDGEFFEENKIRKDGKLNSMGHYTETCQYYAMFCEIAPSDLCNRMIHYFGSNRDIKKVFPKVSKSNAFIGNILRLNYLFENKFYHNIINESKEYFLKMAEMTGTLWENDNTSASCNHGFASIIGMWILESNKILHKEKIQQDKENDIYI